MVNGRSLFSCSDRRGKCFFFMLPIKNVLLLLDGLIFVQQQAKKKGEGEMKHFSFTHIICFK